jgi:cell division protein FtsZ
VLLSIQGGSNLGIFEINDAARLVQEAVHPEANIIFGAVIDDTLGDEVRVTVIAAGFDGGEPQVKPVETRRSTFVAAGSSGSDGSGSELVDTQALEEEDVPTKGSWSEDDSKLVEAAVIDPAFDDDDVLDVPDFLK